MLSFAAIGLKGQTGHLMVDEISLRELVGFDEIRAIHPLLRQANAALEQPLFEARLRAMLAQGGYRCLAAFLGERLVGVAGFWVGTQFWCGKKIEPDNVFVDPELRSLGIGAKLMIWIEAEGERLGCDIVKLDMQLGKDRTHAFYQRLDYCDDGLVLVKALSRGAATFPEYATHLTRAS